MTGDWFAFSWKDIGSAGEWLIALGIVVPLCVLVLIWHKVCSDVGDIPVTFKLPCNVRETTLKICSLLLVYISSNALGIALC